MLEEESEACVAAFLACMERQEQFLCTNTLAPSTQAGCWDIGADTHLRTLLGSGMLSLGLEACMLPRAHPALILLWPAPCLVQGDVAQASARHHVLQTGWEMVSGSLEQTFNSLHISPGPTLVPCKG